MNSLFLRRMRQECTQNPFCKPHQMIGVIKKNRSNIFQEYKDGFFWYCLKISITKDRNFYPRNQISSESNPEIRDSTIGLKRLNLRGLKKSWFLYIYVILNQHKIGHRQIDFGYWGIISYPSNPTTKDTWKLGFKNI